MIDILMATWNGEKHISAQIDSILSQTYRDWHLIIRDDGSTDKTMVIVERYRTLHPNKITVINDNLGNLGPSQNFNKLTEYSTADYIAYSDQDDVFFSSKLMSEWSKLRYMEAEYGDIPIMVCSDMEMTDEKLNIIADSFWKLMKINPDDNSHLVRYLNTNIAPGSTMMINKKLKDAMMPIPKDALMYDWWTGLVACAAGKVGYVPYATQFYRRHGGNVTRSMYEYNTLGIIKKIFNIKKVVTNTKIHLSRTRKQAEALAVRYWYIVKWDNSSSDYARILIYATLHKRNFFMRRYLIVKHRLWAAGLLRNIAMMVVI